MAAKYGISILPSSQGGTDYAYGGALTGGINPSEPTSPSIIDQVEQFVAKGPADNRALYLVQGAGNDFLVLVKTGEKLGNTPIQAAENLTTAISLLHSDGARFILTTTLPDVGRVPAADGFASIFTALSLEFNQAFISQVSALPFDVIVADTFSLANNVLDDPTRFGFLPNAPTTPCPDNTGECIGYIFIEGGLHLTTSMNQVVADYLYSVFSAPNFYASLAENFSAIFATQNLQLRQYLPPVNWSESCGWQVFASGSYAVAKNPTPDRQDYRYDSHTDSATIGAKKVTCQNVMGLAYSYYWSDIDFDNNHGGYDAHTGMVSLFEGYEACKWFVNGIASYAWTDYSNIERRFLLGPAPFVNRGSTHGRGYDLAADGGYYLFRNACLKSGPTITLDYNQARVSGYKETGDELYTAIAFASQKFDIFTTSVGWQVASVRQFRRFCLTSNLFVNVNKPWNNEQRDLHFHVITLPTTHGFLQATFSNDVYVSAGIRAKATLCNGWVLGASYEGNFGNDQRRQNIIAADLSVPLRGF